MRSEPLNDVNKAGARHPSVPVDTVNIPSDAADLSDMERLMRDVAAEMHVDAERAVDDLRKDKELWSRVQRLKRDANTQQEDVNEHHDGVAVDAGISLFLNLTQLFVL